MRVEPHPRTADRLRANVRRWPRSSVCVEEAGASNAVGLAHLLEPVDFARKTGTPQIARSRAVTGHPDSGRRAHEVRTVRLDDLLGDQAVGVVKLDVEGHELAVLEGARNALEQRRMRDIFFESHDDPPTPVTNLLEQCGHQIFAINQRFRGPALAVPQMRERDWDAPMYLATVDPDRAKALIAPDGWRCLRPRSVPWRGSGNGQSGVTSAGPRAAWSTPEAGVR